MTSFRTPGEIHSRLTIGAWAWHNGRGHISDGPVVGQPAGYPAVRLAKKSGDAGTSTGFFKRPETNSLKRKDARSGDGKDWIVVATGERVLHIVRRLRCYLGFHRWQTLQSESGGAYKKCRDCGKFSDVSPPTFLPGGY